MTDPRMTGPTDFEDRLEARIRAHAAVPVRPVDPSAVARSAMAARPVRHWWAFPERRSRLAGFRVARVAILVALLALALGALGGALWAGGRLLDLTPDLPLRTPSPISSVPAELEPAATEPATVIEERSGFIADVAYTSKRSNPPSHSGRARGRRVERRATSALPQPPARDPSSSRIPRAASKISGSSARGPWTVERPATIQTLTRSRPRSSRSRRRRA